MNEKEAGDKEKIGSWTRFCSNPIYGICLGAGVGIIWGGAIGNPGVGLVIGAALGWALVKVMRAKKT